MATFVTYALLILDVLVIALLVQLVVFGPIWLLRRRRTVTPIATPASAPGAGQGFGGGEGFGSGAGFGSGEGFGSTAGFGTGARKRRCDNCRSGWVGEPGTDASTLVLRLRRSARRRAKRHGRPAPAWAVKQGWDRCPSCFSGNVRDSRKQVDVGR